MAADGRHTLVVGGGIIGIACAHYLTDAGFRVTVVDQAGVGSGCSRRNCGFVSPSHVLPLAGPGAIGSALKALLSSAGAFRIRPRLDPALWRWLWNFACRCNRHDQVQSGRAIQPLLLSSKDLYRKLVGDLDCEWQERGLLMVYRNRALFEAYASVNDLLASEFSESAQRLEGDALREFEPALNDSVVGAWHCTHDAHLRPESLLTSWRSLLDRRGVRFIENCKFDGFQNKNGKVVAASVSEGVIEADAFVIAIGAWTPKLARILRQRVPIEPGKGYSILVPRPESCPQVPMLLPEHRVAVTPLQAGMRIGSIMEFAGYDTRIPVTRLRQLQDGATLYLREPITAPVSHEWYGWRPMTYDSVPVIGICPSFSNVYVAAGHNMLGLSMAPATGRLISEILSGTEPHIDMRPYRAERF